MNARRLSWLRSESLLFSFHLSVPSTYLCTARFSNSLWVAPNSTPTQRSVSLPIPIAMLLGTNGLAITE